MQNILPTKNKIIIASTITNLYPYRDRCKMLMDNIFTLLPKRLPIEKLEVWKKYQKHTSKETAQPGAQLTQTVHNNNLQCNKNQSLYFYTECNTKFLRKIWHHKPVYIHVFPTLYILHKYRQCSWTVHCHSKSNNNDFDNTTICSLQLQGENAKCSKTATGWSM